MRRVLTILLACAFLTGMIGCSNPLHNSMYDDEAKLAKRADSMAALLYIGSNMGDGYRLTATLSGASTVWSYRAPEDSQVEMEYTLSVTDGGKAKLVLITPEDEVITLVENVDHSVQEEPVVQVLSLPQGENRIKIVGYDGAKLELTLKMEKGSYGS